MWEQKAKGHTSGFEHPVIEERIYPERTFENPQTIIAIALAYPTKIKEKVPRDEKRGMFARCIFLRYSLIGPLVSWASKNQRCG